MLSMIAWEHRYDKKLAKSNFVLESGSKCVIMVVSNN